MKDLKYALFTENGKSVIANEKKDNGKISLKRKMFFL